jgi:hypothetical protein
MGFLTRTGIATVLRDFQICFFIHGPDGSCHSGTLPHSAENQATDIARVLRKVSGEGSRTIVPTNAAADDFVEYCDTFFPNTCLVNDGVPGLTLSDLTVLSLTDIPARRQSRRPSRAAFNTNLRGDKSPRTPHLPPSLVSLASVSWPCISKR